MCMHAYTHAYIDTQMLTDASKSGNPNFSFQNELCRFPVTYN